MLSINVEALLDGSASVSDEQLCEILGALSCADRDSMLRVAQTEKEVLLRGAVTTVERDAASKDWARSGKLSALGQGLADVIPGYLRSVKH